MLARKKSTVADAKIRYHAGSRRPIVNQVVSCET